MLLATYTTTVRSSAYQVFCFISWEAELLIRCLLDTPLSVGVDVGVDVGVGGERDQTAEWII